MVSGDAIETLRNRGVTCNKLKGLERAKRNDAKRFRSLGFTGKLAQREIDSANDLKNLRDEVCKLR